MTQEESIKFLDKVASSLGDHFDSVQILVSWNEQGMTHMSSRGCGNWYARQGMAREFIQMDQAQTQAAELQKVLPHPDHDS